MAQLSRYFVSRITKSGQVTPEGIIGAIHENNMVKSGKKFAWTFTSVLEGEFETKIGSTYWIGGKITKYEPVGSVNVVDEERSIVRLEDEPNLEIASAQFVYVPTYSAVSHRHIWNKITANNFRHEFIRLVRAYYKDFFAELELTLISDRRKFFIKLAEMTEIDELSASVVPSNPLFGPHWREFREYMKMRKADRIKISEKAIVGESLNTLLPQIARSAVGSGGVSTSSEQQVIMEKPLPIADAAVLMATDGYGHAQVTGSNGDIPMVARTSDKSVEMRLHPDLSVEMLAKATVLKLEDMSRKRLLEHGDK